MTKDQKTSKLTPEILAKLRGFAVVSDTIEFKVEIIDVPDDCLPVFVVRNLSVLDTQKIKEQTNKIKDSNSDEMNSLMEEIVRTHIVGWRNLYDLSTLTKFNFKGDNINGCDLDAYNMLPTGIKSKVLAFIYSLTGIFS